MVVSVSFVGAIVVDWTVPTDSVVTVVVPVELAAGGVVVVVCVVEPVTVVEETVVGDSVWASVDVHPMVEAVP